MSKTVKLSFSREDMLARSRELFKDEPFDWTEVLRVMTKAMQSHPDWRRVVGTPLENDLPVRAAEVFFEIVEGNTMRLRDAK